VGWANQYRRSEESRQAILAAAIEICGTAGFAAASIEAIARRAGVGKQTIYRWWTSKGAVLLDAINTALGDTTDFPDTGDVVADMTSQMYGVMRFFNNAELSPVFRAVVAGAQDDPVLAERMLSELIEPRRQGARQRLALAVERGEMPPDRDPHQSMELLYGPMYYRLLITGEPIDESFVDALVSTVIRVK
jgi:AcrR family transcriptional regulator